MAISDYKLCITIVIANKYFYYFSSNFLYKFLLKILYRTNTILLRNTIYLGQEYIYLLQRLSNEYIPNYSKGHNRHSFSLSLSLFLSLFRTHARKNPLSVTWRTTLLNLDNAPPFFFLMRAREISPERISWIKRRTRKRKARLLIERLSRWIDSGLEFERIIK